MYLYIMWKRKRWTDSHEFEEMALTPRNWYTCSNLDTVSRRNSHRGSVLGTCQGFISPSSGCIHVIPFPVISTVYIKLICFLCIFPPLMVPVFLTRVVLLWGLRCGGPWQSEATECSELSRKTVLILRRVCFVAKFGGICSVHWLGVVECICCCSFL